MMPERVPLIYVRLSMDETDGSKLPTEIKLDNRKLQCLGLAAQHDLEVTQNDIYIERQSGQTIVKRVEFSEVLRRCKVGEVSHLIIPFFDRLTRGSKEDEALIERALKIGKVILISSNGVMDFGDPDFDSKQGLQFAINNMMARQYVHELSKKHREANKIKVKTGEHRVGVATYGYEWEAAVYERKKLVKPGQYVVVEEEYNIVCEFFERVKKEALNKIARDLNNRFQTTGHPNPTKSDWRPAKAWYPKTLREMLYNPFYAGYPAHRFRTSNYGMSKIKMPESEWMMSEEEQAYPHPITRTEQLELQEIVNKRQLEGVAKPACNTILSGGILFCTQDERMRGNQHDYACRCSEYGQKHQTKAISKPRIHYVAQQIVQDCISAMPEDILTATETKSNRGDFKIEYTSLSKRLREEEAKARELMENAKFNIEVFGEAMYKKVCIDKKVLVDKLSVRVSELQTILDQPDISEIRPVLAQLMEYGFDAFWADASREVIREIIPYFIEKIKLIAPGEGRKECRAVEVTLTDLAMSYLPPDYPYRTENFPLIGRAGLGLGRKMPLSKNGNRVHRKLPHLT